MSKCRIVQIANKGSSALTIAEFDNRPQAMEALKRLLIEKPGGRLNKGGQRGSYTDENGAKVMLLIYRRAA